MNLLTQLPVTYLLSTITTIILIAYAILLYRITGRNRSADKLVSAFTIVLLLGFGYHLWLFNLMAHEASFIQYDSPMS
jgi:RsiW-degrading membrane proteinase PrsW (M82 family)